MYPKGQRVLVYWLGLVFVVLLTSSLEQANCWSLCNTFGGCQTARAMDETSASGGKDSPQGRASAVGGGGGGGGDSDSDDREGSNSIKGGEDDYTMGGNRIGDYQTVDYEMVGAVDKENKTNATDELTTSPPGTVTKRMYNGPLERVKEFFGDFSI